MHTLLAAYLPYVLAFCWMVMASRLPFRRIVQNGIVTLFLGLLLLSAMPRARPSKALCVLTLIAVAVPFFSYRLDKRGLN